MSLILKQETASSIPAPPSGKTTIFVDLNGVVNSVGSNGTVQTFPTVGGSNTQLIYNNAGSLAGDANLTYIASTGTLTAKNLSVTGTLNAGDISVSSIANGTSNVDIVGVSGNITTSVGGVANVLVVTTTGANVAGILSASGNVIANSKLLVGTNTTTLTNPVAVFTGAGATYSQLSMQNPTGSGSADITVYGNNGDDTQSWSDVGFTGNTFSDANYTVTAPGDGYFFVQGNSSFGGNMVIATGAVGTVKDIVFATGGFLTGNIKARLYNANGTFSVTGNVNGGNIITAGIISAAGNLNAGNVTSGGIVSATGNVTAGNLVTGGVLGVSGNANVGNLGTTGVFATTLSATGNANVGNIGATGVLAATLGVSGNANVANLGTVGVFANTLSATANANVGNIGTAGLITATGNIQGGNLITAGIVSATGNIQGGNLITAGIVSATGGATFAGNVAMTSKNITGLADPVNAQDAATKNYVDVTAQGLHVHASATAATTGTLATATGGTMTYNNGTSGVGATLTTTGSYTTIDGINIASVGTRILVKNEANAAWNGVYTYTSSTVITRATDFDNATEVAGGDFLFVTSGSTQADTGWVQTTDAPITIGTTSIVFSQFSGAGTYAAGTGLTLTGTTFSVNASQTQITAVGTLTGLSVSGNANIGNIGTTGVFATTLSATGNANVGNIGATNIVGTLTTASQTNITAVGSLASVSVLGTATVGNLSAAGGFVSALGNVTGSNIISTTNHLFSVASAISAAGSTQGTATAISKDFNLVSTVASGAGVIFPAAVAGMRFTIINTSANALLVYPATSGVINSLATNAAYSQPAGARLDYIATSSTQWYTLNATYG